MAEEAQPSKRLRDNTTEQNTAPMFGQRPSSSTLTTRLGHHGHKRDSAQGDDRRRKAEAHTAEMMGCGFECSKQGHIGRNRPEKKARARAATTTTTRDDHEHTRGRGPL